LTPFFCRHALNLDWAVAGAPVGEVLVDDVLPEVVVGVAVVVEAPFATALVLEAVPEELPPHALRLTLASVRMTRAPAVRLPVPLRVSRAFSIVGIELLIRGSVLSGPL
jgi:hypothetical protein